MAHSETRSAATGFFYYDRRFFDFFHAPFLGVDAIANEIPAPVVSPDTAVGNQLRRIEFAVAGFSLVFPTSRRRP